MRASLSVIPRQTAQSLTFISPTTPLMQSKHIPSILTITWSRHDVLLFMQSNGPFADVLSLLRASQRKPSSIEMPDGRRLYRCGQDGNIVIFELPAAFVIVSMQSSELFFNQALESRVAWFLCRPILSLTLSRFCEITQSIAKH